MDTIKWGIIGVGDVAEVKSGPAFQKAQNSKLVAVMRRNTKKAADFAKRHNVPFWFDTIDEILAHPEINAIYIATPPSTHLEIAKQCLQANKFVYLEKPMTLNYVQTQELSNIINIDTKIVVAHYRRALDTYKKVKELIDSRAIGKVLFTDLQILQSKKNNVIAETEDNWRLQPAISGGGYFHDIAPHQIDLMYHYFGDIESASGFSSSSKNDGVDDIINGIIKFKNGVHFRGIWNFNASEKDVKDECKIYGEKGVITFSFYSDDVHLSTEKEEKTFTFSNPQNIQLPMIAKTVDYFLNKGDNPCTVKEASEIIKMMDIFTGKI